MVNGGPVLAEKDQCNGCQACLEACSRKAIVMVADEEGFLHPTVQVDRCIGCRKCEQACPVLCPPPGRRAHRAWGAVSLNCDEVARSSSGAIFQLLASQVLSEGGQVFGARLDDSLRVIMDSCETVEGLEPFQGSKYVQADVRGVYSRARESLKAGRKVLFSGTPCQIAGLRNSLGTQDFGEQLITVGFVCHGVPSPGIWAEYVREREAKSGAKATGARFRDKCLGWLNFSMMMSFSDGSCYSCIHKHDPFIRGFLKHLFIRPSCHCCHFRNPSWCQDITLADFWQVRKILPEMVDLQGGTSLVFAHTVLGERVLESLGGRWHCREIDVQTAMDSNPAALVSSTASPYRQAFWEDHGQFPLLQLLRWYAYASCVKTILNTWTAVRRHFISRQIPDSRPRGRRGR